MQKMAYVQRSSIHISAGLYGGLQSPRRVGGSFGGCLSSKLLEVPRAGKFRRG